MVEPIRVHRYLIGNQRVIGLELPEPARNHNENSERIQSLKARFADCLSAAHARVNTPKLLPSVVRALESIISSKNRVDFLGSMEFSQTRNGRVLINFRIPAILRDLPLKHLALRLKEVPEFSAHEVVVKQHSRKTRP